MEETPSAVELQIRKRAFKPKSRNGCKTCKIRRIKCDEQKPSCERCLRTGRKCDGYTPTHLSPLQVPCIVLEPVTGGNARVATSQTKEGVKTLLPYHLFHSPQERRSFDFFLTCTVPQLSIVVTSEFWTRNVLQASHHEVAIKYAIVALGALHEGCVRGDSRIRREGEEGSRLSFATSQYVKAIGQFCDPERKEKKRMDVVLITCILFICFELLRCQLDSALSHINGGVRILEEFQKEGPFTIPAIPYVSVATVRNIFNRLDSQASQLTFGRRRHLLSGLPNMTLITRQLKFSTLEDARTALDDIWSSVTLNIATERPSSMSGCEAKKNLEKMQSSINQELETWIKNFGALVNSLKSKGPLDGPMRNSINTMKLQWTTIRLLRQTDAALMVEDEMFWDGFKHEFEVMLAMAQTIVDYSTPTPLSAPKPPKPTKESSVSEKPSKNSGEELLFYLDNSILFPLFFIVAKSRDRKLRRKALTLLEQANRQEGVWNSNLLARVARRTIEIEEEGLEAEDLERIPRERRVWRASALFEVAPRKAKIVFVRVGRPSVEEYLEW